MNGQPAKRFTIFQFIGYLFLFVILFPLGFYLVLRRLRRARGKGDSVARIMLVFGCVLLVLAILLLIVFLYTGIDPMGHFLDITTLFLLVLIPGACFFSAGLYYLKQEKIIRQYRTLFGEMPVMQAEEACRLLKTEREQLFTSVTLFVAEGVLEELFISYDQQMIMKRDSEAASVRYCSTCGRAIILTSAKITVCPDCGGLAVMRTPFQEADTEGTGDRRIGRIGKVLWITAAILSATTGYFLWPLCLLLTAAACMTEMRQERPDYQLIRRCGLGILFYDLLLTFSPGIFYMRDTLPGIGAAQFLNYLSVCFLFFPCFLIAASFFRKRYGHIQMCMEAERELHLETAEEICRYTGIGQREAGAIRKILNRRKEQEDRGEGL